MNSGCSDEKLLNAIVRNLSLELKLICLESLCNMNNQIIFPKLEQSPRDREYKKVSVQLRDKAGYSHRKSLIRYKENLYSEDELDWFFIGDESVYLPKKIGIYQFKEGVRIDRQFHDVFNSEDSQYHSKRGESRKVKVLFNNRVFDARYCHENQSDKSICLQHISFFNSLKEEFKRFIL